MKFFQMQSAEDIATDERRELAAQLKKTRLEVARREQEWTEIPQTNLVRRGPHFLVDADTDRAYTRRNGDVFDPGAASHPLQRERLAFSVDEANDIVFLEPTGKTWTQMLERKSDHKRRRLEREAELRERRRQLMAAADR